MAVGGGKFKGSHVYFEEIEKSRARLQERTGISDHMLKDIGFGLWLRSSYVEFQSGISDNGVLDASSHFIGAGGKNIKLCYISHCLNSGHATAAASITEHYPVQLTDSHLVKIGGLEDQNPLAVFYRRLDKINPAPKTRMVWQKGLEDICVTCTVDADDIDLFGHLNNAMYHEYFEKGMYALQESYDDLREDSLKEKGCRLLTSKCYMEYRSQIKAGERVDMQSAFLGTDGGSGPRFYMVHKISSDDAVVAMGVTEQVGLTPCLKGKENPFQSFAEDMPHVNPEEVIPLIYAASLAQSSHPDHQNIFKL